MTTWSVEVLILTLLYVYITNLHSKTVEESGTCKHFFMCELDVSSLLITKL